jgi:hypothetical protein
MAGNMVGRHAETMPADTSMAVQPTVGARVYDGSFGLYEKRTDSLYADANTTLPQH